MSAAGGGPNEPGGDQPLELALLAHGSSTATGRLRSVTTRRAAETSDDDQAFDQVGLRLLAKHIVAKGVDSATLIASSRSLNVP